MFPWDNHEGWRGTEKSKVLSGTLVRQCFSLEHPVYSETLITFPVSRHTLPYLGVIQVGG